MRKKVSAFAPGSIANLFVGFDILGLGFDQVGDIVTIEELKNPSSEIEISISMINKFNPAQPLSISSDFRKNTAGMALFTLMKEEDIKASVHLTIEKGIPLSSGLGGSAASAIGAVVAAKKFFNLNLSHEKLIEYALHGEYVASKSFHADNLLPSLMGGLNLIISNEPFEFISLPTPNLWLTVIHPHMELETAVARGVLSDTVSRKAWISQSQYLAGFISACYTNNLTQLGKTFQDIIIEPQRKHLIPGFDQLKKVALKLGAYGFTISGAGPTMMAISPNEKIAKNILSECSSLLLKDFQLDSDCFTSSMKSSGAKVL